MESTIYLKNLLIFFISPSSTNAYMLIYRLKDPTRNASMLAPHKVIFLAYLANLCNYF